MNILIIQNMSGGTKLMAGYTGLSFPFRIGFKGRTVMSSTTDMEVAHIIESIKQILLTQKGERVNEPEFGADLYHVVFENIDETIVSVIEHKVRSSLEKWEPRINVNEIFVQEFDGGVEITVKFTVITTLLETSTSVSIKEAA